MSYIWCTIIILSIIVSFAFGTADKFIEIISTSSLKAIQNCLTLLGMTCFWTGIFNVLKNTSLIKCIAKILTPILSKLFNKEEINEEINENMSLNITCNMLGVGNAATVYGLKTAEEMSKASKEKGVVSDNLATFIIINTASLQLIPTSIISILILYKAERPTGILVPLWITSIVSLLVGIIMIKVLNKVVKK